MNKTTISWTDYTSNPLRARNLETGKAGHYCEKVSPGCAHCYASEWNTGRFGTGVAFLPANRSRVEPYLNERELAEWSKAKYSGAKVFVCDMTDLFGEWVSDGWLQQIFEAMGAASLVTFQVLTKRPERARQWIGGIQGRGWPLPNVWLGVSAENQRWADERIPILLDTPAAVRFVSYEPAIGPIDFRRWVTVNGNGRYGRLYDYMALNWIIIGGESGLKRRSFDVAWARDVIDLGRETQTACWMKQNGGRFPESWDGIPETLRVREFPR